VNNYDALRACVRLRQARSYIEVSIRRLEREQREQPQNTRLPEILALLERTLDELDQASKLLNPPMTADSE